MNEELVITSESKYSGLNVFQRIFGIIFSPGKVMQDLEQKPRILFALILTIITPIVMIFSIFPVYQAYLLNNRAAVEATYEKMNIQMSTEQIDKIIMNSSYSTPFIMAVMATAMWFLGALVLWGAIKIIKGKGTYKQILSVTGYAAVISALGALVTIITSLIAGTFTEVSYTSLASLIPDMKGSFIYGAAKTIEVFSIWMYVVIAIGTAAVSKLDKKKVYFIITCIFAALVIYSAVTEVRTAALF